MKQKAKNLEFSQEHFLTGFTVLNYLRSIHNSVITMQLEFQLQFPILLMSIIRKRLLIIFK